VLHQHSLVLELVTLALLIQSMEQVLVNFGGLSVFLQQPTQNTHAPNPDNLRWKTSFACTPAFTKAGVPAFPLGLQPLVATSSRVDGVGLLDTITVLDQFADVLPAVGVVNFVDLVGVQPHLPFPAAQYASRKALLQLQSDHSDDVSDFGINQLLNGSISLSPLFTYQTIDLHVSIATSLHQNFFWLYHAHK